MRIGILGSTRGTHLHTLVKAIAAKKINANIALVLSNKKDAIILQAAEKYELNTYFVDPNGCSSREVYDEKISLLLKEHDVDLVILIGYMRILSAQFTNIWKHKVINIHPSLLPRHAKKMDLLVHEAVLSAKELETGCTIHYVTEEVDQGPILLQKKCSVLSDDTPISLKSRVQALEAETLIAVIQQLS